MKSAVTGALGAAAWLFVGTLYGQPQDGPTRGNFNPQQMRQRMLENMRQQFGVKEDSEWKAIGERIEKVMEARRAVGSMGGGPGGPRMMGSGGPGSRGGGGPGGMDSFGGGPGGPGGPGEPGGGPAQGGDNGGPPGGPGQGGPGEFRPPDMPSGMGGMNRDSDPELQALRKALEDKASNSDVKAKLTALREARKKKEAALEAAQAQLREILSARQEAVAVMMGLLK